MMAVPDLRHHAQVDPEGVTVRREHARGDVAARGSASDLALFLYNRVGPEKLEVFGNAALLERFFELAPSL